MSKMNLPNKLTMLRMVLIPFFVAVYLLPESVISAAGSSLIAAAIFIAASVTDTLDGKIARKYNLITDFGKLMDPLADKFLVMAALLVVIYRIDTLRLSFVFLTMVIIFRELAVATVRSLVASKGGKVMAAAMPGKIKTVCQMVCLVAVLVEPALWQLCGAEKLVRVMPLTGIFAVATLVMTVWSGIDYCRCAGQYIETK